MTLYRAGYLGSGLARRDNDGDIGIAALVRLAGRRAVTSISADAREALVAHGRADDLAVSVVTMHDREELGPSAGLAQFKVRPGLDALTVTSAAGSRTLLPSVGPYNGWDSDGLVAHLQTTAAGSSVGASWSTSRTASWIRQRRGATSAVDRVEFGFVARPSEPVDLEDARALSEAMADHILRRIAPSGLPTYDLDAISGRRVCAEGTTPRVVHALASLAEAGRLLDRPDMVAAARRGLSICLRHVGAGGVPGELAHPGSQARSARRLRAAQGSTPGPRARGSSRRGGARSTPSRPPAGGRPHRATASPSWRRSGPRVPSRRCAHGYRTVRRAVGDAAAPRRTQAAAPVAARPLPSRPRVVDGRLASAGLGGDPPHQPRSGHRGSRLRDRGLGHRPPADEERRRSSRTSARRSRASTPASSPKAWRRPGRSRGARATTAGPNDTRTRGAGRPASSGTITVHPEDVFASHAGAAALGGVRLTPSSARLRIERHEPLPPRDGDGRHAARVRGAGADSGQRTSGGRHHVSGRRPPEALVYSRIRTRPSSISRNPRPRGSERRPGSR